MTDGRRSTWRAWSTWVLVAAPAVLAAGFFVRPYVSNFTDNGVVAAAIEGGPGRWVAASILMVAGVALLIFALPETVERLGDGDGRGRWVRPAVTIGVVIFSLQVGLVAGGVGASRMGVDVAEFLDAIPLEGTAISLSLLGLLVAWAGVIRVAWSSGLSAAVRGTVVVGAALGALGHLYPGSPGEYVAAVGTAAALWPIAALRPEVHPAPGAAEGR